MATVPSILVADDEPGICSLLKKVLTKQGYRVFTTTSGQRVVSILKTRDVQLVLLDLKMPDMGGLEVLGKIRAMKKGTLPAVVILTGQGSPSSAREAIRLGAVDYLAKPFDLDLFNAVVKEALRGK